MFAFCIAWIRYALRPGHNYTAAPALNLTFANFFCTARISHDCKLAATAGKDSVRSGHSPFPLPTPYPLITTAPVLRRYWVQITYRDVVRLERVSKDCLVGSRLPICRDRCGEFCVYKWVESHLSRPKMCNECRNLTQPVTAVSIFGW